MWSMQVTRLSLVLDFKHQEIELAWWNEKKKERKSYRERFPKKEELDMTEVIWHRQKVWKANFHEEGGFLECLSLTMGQESQGYCLFLTNTQTMLHKYLNVASDFYSISWSSAKPHKLIIFFTSGYQFSGKKGCKSPGFSKTRAQIRFLCDSVLSHSNAALIMVTKMDKKRYIVQNLDLYKAFCTNNDLGALYTRVREKQTLS